MQSLEIFGSLLPSILAAKGELAWDWLLIVLDTSMIGTCTWKVCLDLGAWD